MREWDTRAFGLVWNEKLNNPDMRSNSIKHSKMRNFENENRDETDGETQSNQLLNWRSKWMRIWWCQCQSQKSNQTQNWTASKWEKHRLKVCNQIKFTQYFSYLSKLTDMLMAWQLKATETNMPNFQPVQ